MRQLKMNPSNLEDIMKYNKFLQKIKEKMEKDKNYHKKCKQLLFHKILKGKGITATKDIHIEGGFRRDNKLKKHKIQPKELNY